MALTNRERFLRLMRGQALDRIPFFPCFGPWPETLARWHREGLAPEADYRTEVGFDGDLRHILPLHNYLCPMPPHQVLSEEGETAIVIDRGVTQRVRKDGHSMPEFLAYPVESREDWRRVKGLLDPDTPGRFPGNWAGFCAEHAARTDPAYAGDLPCGFFGGPRELLGFERLMYWLYDEPVLIDLVGQLPRRRGTRQQHRGEHQQRHAARLHGVSPQAKWPSASRRPLRGRRHDSLPARSQIGTPRRALPPEPRGPGGAAPRRQAGAVPLASTPVSRAGACGRDA